MADEKALWYVVHTYSGYENKVANDLVKTVENNGMGDLIQEVTVPIEEVVEIRNGKPHTIQHKLFPGYVLVKMIKTTESWYVVRNTRGVTGFVGPDSKPVALTPAEVDMMLSTQQNSVEFGIAIGEEVRILSGPLENFTGVVEDVDTVRQKLTVKVKMFLGREMPVEVDLQDVEKVQPKNNAENLCYQAEKLVNESGDKLEEADKTEVNNKVAALKTTMQNGTVEEINAEEHKVKVSIEILNRKTTVEYDISEVERL